MRWTELVARAHTGAHTSAHSGTRTGARTGAHTGVPPNARGMNQLVALAIILALALCETAPCSHALSPR